jgi:hypothetical protein
MQFFSPIASRGLGLPSYITRSEQPPTFLSARETVHIEATTSDPRISKYSWLSCYPTFPRFLLDDRAFRNGVLTRLRAIV